MMMPTSTVGYTMLPGMDDQQPKARRSSSDGSDADSGSDDATDTGSSSTDDDDDISDDETLADRQARSLGAKRATESDDQGQPAKRRRSSSDSGGSTGSGSRSSRKRRNLFPAIRRSQRCGSCHTCLNPQLKKACMTVRERMMKEMQDSSGSSKPHRSAAKAAAGAQQQQPLSPAGSADLDQDKYVDLLMPLIDSTGALTDAASVTPFIKAMASFKSTLARVLPMSVLSLSKPSLLADFMAGGGVDVLAAWMLDAMGEDSDHAKSLLLDILGLLQKLPVTKAFVQSTKSAKVIGALRKHDSVEVRKLARHVVDLWMKVIPNSSSNSSVASSAKPGSSAARPAGGASGAAAAASGSGLQATAARKAGQGNAGVGAAAARPSGGQVQMISDNDLFKPAAATAKSKTSLRPGMGQPKKSPGVQLMDAAEAGRLLSGSSAATTGPGKVPPLQRGRVASPPPVGGQAAAGSAGQQRVALDLQVTPEETVTVTLRVVQPPAGRLPGLRRTGFGSSLGTRPGGAAGAAGAGGAQGVAGAGWGAGAGAGVGAAARGEAALGADRKPRKARKRVSFKSDRELESVRWFIKDDPAINARQDAELSEEQLRAMQLHQQHSFHDLMLMEHQHERTAMAAQHREEEEARRAALAALHPTCPWHGTPPNLEYDPVWEVAFGEDSTEVQQPQRPFGELLYLMQYGAPGEPVEGPGVVRPPHSSFNAAHFDPNVTLIPLLNAVQQQQQKLLQEQQQQQVVQPPPALSAPQAQPQAPQQLQQQASSSHGITPQQAPQQPPPPPQRQQQQQQQPYLPQPQQPPPTVTYTLGQGMQVQPQLVVQQLPQSQPPAPPPLQQQQQQPLPPQQPAAAVASSGPPSSSDNSQLLQVLQSLSQSGFLAAGQQQQPLQQPPQQPPQQQQQQPVVSQMQLQPPPQQQLQLQPQPMTLLPTSSGAPQGQQVITLQGGMQVLLPPGVTALPGQTLQLPPGFVLAPAPPQQQQQQPPGQPPVVMYPGQPAMQLPPPGAVQGDFGPPPGPAAPWGGPHAPPPGPSGPPGPPHREGPGPYGRGRGEGAGGPQRHARGGRGGRGGGPYHRDHRGAQGGAAGGHGRPSNARACKFFNTPRGCSKGDLCDFRHVLAGSEVDVRDSR